MSAVCSFLSGQPLLPASSAEHRLGAEDLVCNGEVHKQSIVGHAGRVLVTLVAYLLIPLSDFWSRSHAGLTSSGHFLCLAAGINAALSITD